MSWNCFCCRSRVDRKKVRFRAADAGLIRRALEAAQIFDFQDAEPSDNGIPNERTFSFRIYQRLRSVFVFLLTSATYVIVISYSLYKIYHMELCTSSCYLLLIADVVEEMRNESCLVCVGLYLYCCF
jgi:hypothetical protein